MLQVVQVTPRITARPSWKTVSIEFDPTQFSVLSAFEEALSELVGDAIYQLRPESTMNAAIVMLAAPVSWSRNRRRTGYAYRWYRLARVGTSGASVRRHMHFPILFDESGVSPADAKTAIENRRPFLFDQPVTLASAFLHHELQRRADTTALLGEIEVHTPAAAARVREYWDQLDKDKKDADRKYCIIHSPGARYPKLHRETFAKGESARGTLATFVKPLIVRDVLLGLFCVDIAAAPASEAGEKAAETAPLASLEQFTKGLVSLGVGIEATLGACAKAYYTHLDRSTVRESVEVARETPILSAAFLETFISEVEHRRAVALTTCAFAYLFFDNNELKLVNTVGNYECGTEIIRATGQWITRGIRRWAEQYNDTGEGTLRDRLDSAPQFWVVRWGGDEFIAVVAGGAGAEHDWEKLMFSIRDEIETGREILVHKITSLRSVKAKGAADREELKKIVAGTSVAVGAVLVDRVAGRKGKRFDGSLAVFLRQARVVAEDRMKLVKNMVKIDQTLRLLVERGQSPDLTIESLKGGLRWCYGDLLKEDLGS
jgi:hypothetical protein